MKLLFTVNKYPLSWLIQKVTGEPVSHVAIVYNNTVYHSSALKGVNSQSLDSFLKTNTIVFEYELLEDPDRLISGFNRQKRAGYDWGAILYLAARYMFPFLPKKNLWQSSGMYLCTEWVTAIIDETEDSMITPYKLYLRLVGE